MVSEIEDKFICAKGEQRASCALKETAYIMCESHVSEKNTSTADTK